jgi:hypothetical protein
MPDPVFLDHLEIHVRDIPAYCEFLVRLFRGGRHRVIGDNGVSMFLTPQGQAFELKPRVPDTPVTRAGFCLPCIRLVEAEAHIMELGLEVHHRAENPDGPVLFFTDHEGIEWHAKSYVRLDGYVNW